MREGETRRTLHVGVVHGMGAVHFVAAADTRAELVREVAGYVRAQAEHQLYPEDAAVVAALFERADEEAAVRYYFDRVGERWDREWLTADEVALAGVNG